MESHLGSIQCVIEALRAAMEPWMSRWIDAPDPFFGRRDKRGFEAGCHERWAQTHLDSTIEELHRVHRGWWSQQPYEIGPSVVRDLLKDVRNAKRLGTAPCKKKRKSDLEVLMTEENMRQREHLLWWRLEGEDPWCLRRSFLQGVNGANKIAEYLRMQVTYPPMSDRQHRRREESLAGWLAAWGTWERNHDSIYDAWCDCMMTYLEDLLIAYGAVKGVEDIMEGKDAPWVRSERIIAPGAGVWPAKKRGLYPCELVHRVNFEDVHGPFSDME